MMRKPLAIRLVSADCITTIEPRQWLPVVFFLATFLWYLASPSRVAAMGMVTLAGMLVVGFAWAYALARQVNGQRALRYYALQVGDQLEEEVTLVNKGFLPVLWAEFHDRSSIPGYVASSVRAAESNSKVNWRVRSICTRRGVFLLGPWEMVMGDPFGLFRVRKEYLYRQEILVYPPLAELPEQLIPQSGVQGDARPLHQPLKATSTDASSARPYAPGDPFRHIHWPTTARKNETYIKIFQPEAASSVWLVPDCDASVQLGEGEQSTFETTVLVAASLAARLLKDQMSVGMLVNSTAETAIAPQRGQQQLWSILRALAPVEPVLERSLAETLEHLRQLIQAHSMVIVITPSLQPAWLSQISRLTGLRGRGRSEVILLDPYSFGGLQSAQSMLPVLAEAGVTGRILCKGEVRPISASYGELSRWEFTAGATGRAILRKMPRSAGMPGSDASTPRYRTWKEQP